MSAEMSLRKGKGKIWQGREIQALVAFFPTFLKALGFREDFLHLPLDALLLRFQKP